MNCPGRVEQARKKGDPFDLAASGWHSRQALDRIGHRLARPVTTGEPSRQPAESQVRLKGSLLNREAQLRQSLRQDAVQVLEVIGPCGDAQPEHPRSPPGRKNAHAAKGNCKRPAGRRRCIDHCTDFRQPLLGNTVTKKVQGQVKGSWLDPADGEPCSLKLPNDRRRPATGLSRRIDREKEPGICPCRSGGVAASGTHDAGSSRQRLIRSRMVAMIGRSLAGRRGLSGWGSSQASSPRS